MTYWSPLKALSPTASWDHIGMAPMLASLGNNFCASSPVPLLSVSTGRIERVLHNLTSRPSRSSHSRRTASSWYALGRGKLRAIEICRRFADLAVLSALLIHLTLGPRHRNPTSLSFTALERSSERSSVSVLEPTRKNMTLIDHGSWGNAPG